MKSWQIHFGWVILTVLAVCIAARVSSERHEALPSKPLPDAIRPTASTPSNQNVAAPLLPEAAAVEPAKPAAAPAASSTVQRIKALLLQEQNYWKEINDTLDGLGDRAEKLALLNEMLVNPKGNARYVALNCLARMKGRDVAEILEGLLKSATPDQWFKPQIADALGKVADPGSVPALYEAMRDANDELQLSVAAALLKLGQTAPAGDLMSTLARLYESPDGSLRKRAIESISKLHPEGALPLLIRALRDSNGDVRLEALYAISGMNKPELLPLVEPLLNDPHPEVAREAQDYVDSLKDAKK